MGHFCFEEEQDETSEGWEEDVKSYFSPKHGSDTPPKINMEPGNGGFQ